MLYRLSAMIGFFVGGVSLGTITAISVERFMSLHYHMRYVIIVTNTRVKYTVGAIWLVIFLSLIFYHWNKYIFHLLGGVFSTVCIIINTISYVKIYQIVRYRQSQIYSHSASHCRKHKIWKQNAIRAIEAKCNEHVYILHLYDCVLFSTFCFTDDIWNTAHRMETRMDLFYYGCFHELIHQPDLVLLAALWA